MREDGRGQEAHSESHSQIIANQHPPPLPVLKERDELQIEEKQQDAGKSGLAVRLQAVTILALYFQGYETREQLQIQMAAVSECVENRRHRTIT